MNGLSSSSDPKFTGKNRIFAMADVARHNTPSSLWLTHNNVVYDFTSFAEDHPGGDDLIHQFAGKDMGGIMSDPASHVHSQSAYEMMSEYRIGILTEGAGTVDENWVAHVDFHPEETDVSNDYGRSKFLDLSKPLLMQVAMANFSKEFYLEQVHQPRHVKDSARLFGPGYLECFTRTKWWVVPMVWGPIMMFLGGLSVVQFGDRTITAKHILSSLTSNPSSLSTTTSTQVLTHLTYPSFLKTLTCFLTGNVIWTLLEYTLHRFLFHVDYYMPDRNWALVLHFLLHGIHHYLPMDRLRLVMPPLLFFVLSYPFTQLAHAVFPAPIANGIISGAFAFYILYDCMHYALHHTRLPKYMAEMKKYHLAHHYKNFELGFGVTSKVWDYAFGTVLPLIAQTK